MPLYTVKFIDNITGRIDSKDIEISIMCVDNIKLLTIVPKCYGCLNNLPSQKDHMECNTGCLYDEKID